MNVTVVGLGKIGLPLAVRIATAGHRVAGADLDERVVAMVNDGAEPFEGEAELGSLLARAVGDGRLHALTDTAAAVGDSQVVVVVVPLVLDGGSKPDFGSLDRATAEVGRGIGPGTLVSYETTLPLRTTRDRLAPQLAAASGLTLGRDLFVCHSPERVFSGRIFADLRRYPKLVGGIDPESATRAVAFYESVLEFDERPDLERPNGVWDLGSAEAAELAKLAETTYRNLNIAYANELAMLADAEGLDLPTAIEAANSQPYSHIHRPGVAIGGHCIPVYPHFLLAGHDLPLVATAVSINEAMPAYTVAVLSEMLGGLAGQRVVVLGASYRGGIKEVAYSGVYAVVGALASGGASVSVHDPLFTPEELRDKGLTPYRAGSPTDGALVQADHEAYAQLTKDELPGVRAVVDGRGVLNPDNWAGVALRRIGDGRD